MLARLSPDRIRSLARRHGYPPDGSDDLEDVSRWLLDHYIKQVGEAARSRKTSILDHVRQSLERVGSRLPLGDGLHSTPDDAPSRTIATADRSPSGPRPPAVSPDDRTHEADGATDVPPLPKDPALRTLTLARVYERQDMTAEALTIYREVAQREPDNREANEAIRRLESKGASDDRGKHAETMTGPPPLVHRDDAAAREPTADLPDLAPLPRAHGVDEAVLMMVTPRSLYACWEVTSRSLERARATAGDSNAPLVLRLSRVSASDAHPHTERVLERPAPDVAGEYFFHDVLPDAIHHLEVGVLSGDLFVPVLRTNAATTPPVHGSRRVDEQWMEVDQRPLDERSPEMVEPRVVARTGLDPEQMAMLRLHEMGAFAYAARTGIDPGRLRVLLERSRGRVPLEPRFDSSSGPTAPTSDER
jgi:hypothetical protein